MKIVFDIDGTLTNFNKFINDNAIEYFKEKYNMNIVNENELEIEDIFDMDTFFMNKYNCDKQKAKIYTKKAIDEFWVNLPRFIKFSLLNKFRDGVKEFIRYSQKRGYDIEIHSSRAKTINKGIIGEICRNFTYLQFVFNGIKIPKDKFYFYENDEKKIEGIIKSNPDIVFEDKKEVLNILNDNNIKTICVNGNHNRDIIETNKLKKIDEYNIDKIEQIFNLIIDKNYLIKKRISESDNFYKKIRQTIPIILTKFKPIILNKENIIKEDNVGVVIAPNHRSTLDPLSITSIIDKNIHWAALKRFFTEEDSIFNNNKNPILCKITSTVFKKMEYFPIERLSDNPKANNFKSIKEMIDFLKNNQYVGIFPEGTTNKSKEKDFGTFDPAFIVLAKKTDAWIQPVTVLWIKELNIKNKMIINFGIPFKVGNMTVEEAYEYYVQIQQKNLDENKEYAKNLIYQKKLLKK